MFEEETQGQLYDLGASFSATYIFYFGNLREQAVSNYAVFQREAKDLGIELSPSLPPLNDLTNFPQQVLQKFSYNEVRYFDLGGSIVRCHITNHCSPEMKAKSKGAADQNLKNTLVSLGLTPQVISNVFEILDADVAEEQLLEVLNNTRFYLMSEGPVSKQQKSNNNNNNASSSSAEVRFIKNPQPHSLKNENIIIGKKVEVKPAPVMRSAVHDAFHLNYEIWVVSLMRKAEEGNTEHAFLMVEGINQFGNLVVKRYDLVKHEVRKGYADILIRPENDEENSNLETVVNLTKGDKCFYQSWQITREQASHLHSNVLLDRQIANDSHQGISYQIVGNEAILPNPSSPSNICKQGHNCFTWAREKLRVLNDPAISNSIKSKITDCIAAKTSLYLKDPEKEKSNCLLI